jgi:hypothetical protein
LDALTKIPRAYQLNKEPEAFPELIETYVEDDDTTVIGTARDWLTPILNEESTVEDLQAFDEYKSALANCSPEFLFGDSEVKVKAKPFALMLQKYLRTIRPIPENFFDGKINLEQIIHLADTEAKKVDRTVFRLLPTAKQNILGYYTSEQSADEFALKIATMGGVSVDDLIEGVLGFMRATDYSMGKKKTDRIRAKNLELDYQSCRKAYEDSKVPQAKTGFSIQREGEFISLGKLSDTHHADCYRVFNLWRLTQVDREIEKAALGLITDKRDLIKLPLERLFISDRLRYMGEVVPLLETWQDMHKLAVEMSGSQANE